MRHLVTVILAGMVVLGAVAYVKLSSEALAVLAGGVLVAVILIPAFVLVIAAMRRSQQAPERPAQPPQHYPPVIVVGGQTPQLPRQAPDPWAVDGQWRPSEDKPRFKVLGEDGSGAS